MQDNLVTDKPPMVSLLLIIVVLVVIGWIGVAQVIGIFAGELIYEGEFLKDIMDPVEHPDIRSALMLSQAVASVIGLIIIPAAYLRFAEHRTLKRFFHQETNWMFLIPLLAIAVLLLAVAISPIVEWNATIDFPESMKAIENIIRNAESAAKLVIDMITRDLTPGGFFIALVVMAVLPAIGEELLFRGLIQTELIRVVKNDHVGIWLAAAFFSTLHFQFLGFMPRVFIGAFLGYLYVWSGNLWVPMLAHFFNNALQLTGLYLYQQGVLSFDIESTESAPLPVVAISIVLIVALLILLKKYFSRSTLQRDLA